jgi:hypothetical protein
MPSETPQKNAPPALETVPLINFVREGRIDRYTLMNILDEDVVSSSFSLITLITSHAEKLFHLIKVKAIGTESDKMWYGMQKESIPPRSSPHFWNDKIKKIAVEKNKSTILDKTNPICFFLDLRERLRSAGRGLKPSHKEHPTFENFRSVLRIWNRSDRIILPDSDPARPNVFSSQNYLCSCLQKRFYL